MSNDQARRLLAEQGPNRIGVTFGHRSLRLLLTQFASPLTLILIAATVVSMALGDLADGLVIR